MAIYYVSVQRGVDANNGTSQATPWLTITKATTIVAANDTVYIGPGTYREKPSFATAGGAGTPITWIPDSMCVYLTSDKPGIVRVTGCGANELPTAGVVWFYNAKNYNTIGDAAKGFGQIYIDGSLDNYSVSVAVVATRLAYGVTAHGYNGFNSGTNTNCAAVGGYYGFNSGTNTNCVARGGYEGFYLGTNTNCIATGGSSGFSSGTNTNCVAQGGNYAFFNGWNTNCVAQGGNYAFAGNGLDTFSRCRAIACRYGFYGTSTTNPLDVSTCSAVWCFLNQRGGGYESGVIATAQAALYDPQLLALALQPLLALDRGDGAEGNLSCISVAAADTVTVNGTVFTAHATTTTVANREFRMNQTDILDAVELVTCINDATYGVSGVVASSATRDVHLQAAAPTTFTLTSSNATRLPVRVAPITGTDILGLNRLLGDGTIDIGTYALSNVATEFTTVKTQTPAVKFTRAGQQRFVFWAEGGTEFTRTVWTQWANVTDKPQLIASGNHIATQTATATGDGTDWEQLTVSATPAAGGEIVILLYGRDVGATATVYFSDIE